jgi:hypothetical protein
MTLVPVLSTFTLTVVVTVTGMTMPVLPDEGLRVL